MGRPLSLTLFFPWRAGGNSNVVDRTVAQLMAFAYYWYVCIVYFFSEPAGKYSLDVRCAPLV
jgi:hypothetical protein